MKNVHLGNSDLEKAAKDYFYLLGRNYPEKSLLKLVGDRYKLSARDRTLLYRGIVHPSQTLNIATRIVSSPPGELIIDGYNVLFTIMNYRLGHLLFLSTDNLCRDAGALFGKIKDECLFLECMRIVTDYLLLFSSCNISIYLDSPVSHSAGHKIALSQLTSGYLVKPVINVVHSADEALLMHSSGTYATSDSAVLKRSGNPVMDIPRAVIENRYHAVLPSMSKLLENQL